MATFADRLNEALEKRNRMPADLSRITKISEAQISAYRKGYYKAGQRNLEKIANALNVPIPWLMGFVDDNPFEININDRVLTAKELSLLSRFRMLDDEDKGEVSGFINGLLCNKKYTEKESHLA